MTWVPVPAQSQPLAGDCSPSPAQSSETAVPVRLQSTQASPDFSTQSQLTSDLGAGFSRTIKPYKMSMQVSDTCSEVYDKAGAVFTRMLNCSPQHLWHTRLHTQPSSSLTGARSITWQQWLHVTNLLVHDVPELVASAANDDLPLQEDALVDDLRVLGIFVVLLHGDGLVHSSQRRMPLPMSVPTGSRSFAMPVENRLGFFFANSVFVVNPLPVPSMQLWSRQSSASVLSKYFSGS